MVEVRIEGDRQLRIYFKGLSQQLEPALRRAVRASLLLLRRKIQKKLTGQVLHVRTGHLKASVSTKMFSGALGGRVGPNKVYAAIHEFGGMAGRDRKVRIPARPYVQPAFEENLSRVEDIFDKYIREILNK